MAFFTASGRKVLSRIFIFRMLAFIFDHINNIIPAGYQPFCRSKLQSAYMLMPSSQDYDMLKDTRFAKLKFRLNENLCEWIYREMGRGDKIYPKDDAPELSKYVSAFSRNDIMFSRSTFDNYCKKSNITGTQVEVLEKKIIRVWICNFQHGY